MSTNGAYDVVILGSGIAGLAGALAAYELGLRPAVPPITTISLFWLRVPQLAAEILVP